jgi:hypothetical protein
MTELKEWESFYVIVGSSAGALIGLQFVVMTLIAERPVAPTELLGKALATPTIVHFGAVLLLASLLSAPWKDAPAVVWGVLGFAGVIYSGIVARRMRAQTEYKPEFEDWIFHVQLPLLAYAILAGSAFAVRLHEHQALFGVGAAALMLLFDGIHNAWDSVTYHVFVSKRGQPKR